MKKKYLIASFIIFGILILDQITKILIYKFISSGESIKIINNFFYLSFHKNSGAAFGIFHGNLLFLICVSILILIYLIYEMKNNLKNMKIFYSICILIGGLLGNLMDRVFLGYVRDFLEFKIFNYNFPIFNISDTFITIGVSLLILFILMEEKNGNKNKRK